MLYVKGNVSLRGTVVLYATPIRNNESQNTAVRRLMGAAIRHFTQHHNNLQGRPSFMEIRGTFVTVPGAIIV